MVTREEVFAAYQLILGREPESEAAIAAHQVEPSLDRLGRRIMASDEFRQRAKSGFSLLTRPTWVCAEIRFGLKLWLDLSDYAVSAECLRNQWEIAETDLILSILQPGDVFVDVGANIGWFTVLAAHVVGTAGHVYAFEPRHDTCAYLARSVAANGFEQRCSVMPFALGAEEAELDLAWIPAEHNPGHSFLVPGSLPEGAERFGRVAVHPLDSLRITSPVRVMKIDVEGAEHQVLHGAEALIGRDHPILVLELFPQWLQAISGSTARSLCDWLRARGYRVFHLSAEGGLGRELHAWDDLGQSDGAGFFNVVAVSGDGCRRLLAHRLDHRVADLEGRLAVERQARAAAEARAENAGDAANDAPPDPR
jgi:FkbM family methyltransferase